MAKFGKNLGAPNRAPTRKPSATAGDYTPGKGKTYPQMGAPKGK